MNSYQRYLADLAIKIKLIYLHFLLLAVGFIFFYCTAIWLVTTRFQLIDLNEDLVNFWLPFCLPFILILIFLRPRVKLLNLKSKRDNLPSLFYFIAAMAITAPTIAIQEYLPLATGTLTDLNSISQITDKPLSRYYELKQHYIDKATVVAHRRTEVSGRNSEYLTFYIYIACPILNNKADTASKGQVPVAWLGTLYTKGMSNNASDGDKEATFKQFGIDTYNQFKNQQLDDFIYLDRIGNNQNRKGYLKAINDNAKYANIKAPLILEAKNEAFEQRTGDKFEWIFILFGIGQAVWFIILLFPKLQPAEITKLPQYSLRQQWLWLYDYLSKIKLSSTPVWSMLIAVNVLVFCVMVCTGLGFMSFEGRDLYNWGANIRPAVVADGQWWRLITSIFLHGGLMHLFLNMYGLVFAGLFLEPIIGKVKFVLAYAFCGIIASLASIWWHPETLSVGASGAIFGLYGVLAALLTTNKADASSKKGLLLFTTVFIVVNLAMGLKGNTDNAAHIGGLLSGIVLGYIFNFFIDKPKPKRIYKRKKAQVEDTDVAIAE